MWAVPRAAIPPWRGSRGEESLAGARGYAPWRRGWAEPSPGGVRGDRGERSSPRLRKVPPRSGGGTFRRFSAVEARPHIKGRISRPIYKTRMSSMYNPVPNAMEIKVFLPRHWITATNAAEMSAAAA